MCNSHSEASVCHCNHHETPVKKTIGGRIKPYRLLIAAVGFVFIFAVVATVIEGYLEFHVFMQYLMAGYFLVFGLMQTLSIKKSAKMFQQYDPIAKRLPVYGFIYPPLQIALGFAYLFWISPIIVNLVAATVLFFTMIGVIDVLERKKEVRCGCLGDSMKVSVSWVTLVENTVMFVMALGMLIYFFGTFTESLNGNTDRSPNSHPHRSI